MRMSGSRLLSAGLMTFMLATVAHGQTTLYANLTNDQEPGVVTPTLSTGGARAASFGSAVFTLAADQLSLFFEATIYNIDFTGTQTADVNDNLVAAHIHASSDPAFTPPTNAGVVFGFFGSPFNDNNPNDVVVTPFATGVGGTIRSTWNVAEGNNTTLTAQLPNIMAGRSYLNFHTTQFAGGEIRGAISTVPEPATMLLLGSGLAGLAALRRKRRKPLDP